MSEPVVARPRSGIESEDKCDTGGKETNILIVNKLDLEDRVFATQKKEATITIKDHKENYQNDTKCRLINPTKAELGKISKQILAKIVAKVKAKAKVNQWKNTDSVLTWFKGLNNKKRLTIRK